MVIRQLVGYHILVHYTLFNEQLYISFMFLSTTIYHIQLHYVQPEGTL
jgi:hypothetical protein